MLLCCIILYTYVYESQVKFYNIITLLTLTNITIVQYNLEIVSSFGRGSVLNYTRTRKTLGDQVIVFGKLTLEQKRQDEFNKINDTTSLRTYIK